jgi:hypothetical protein
MHRATDDPGKGRMWVWLRRLDWAIRVFVPVFAVAVTAYAVVNVSNQNDKLEAQSRATIQESVERRDQNCVLFERQEKAAILRVVATYHYLRTLPAEDRGTNLTKAILRNLPAAEADAKAAVAPDYCNLRGVGLPELKADPVLPEHQDFRHLSRP